MNSKFVGLRACLWIFPFYLTNLVFGDGLPKNLEQGLLSEDFAVRKQTELDVLAWAQKGGKSSEMVLLKLAKFSDEPELKQRAIAVLKMLAEKEFYKTGEGYVGMMMMDQMVIVPGKAKAQAVIHVSQVVAGSPAQKMGIQLNDLVVALDGGEWQEGLASTMFGDAIRKKAPGTIVKLKILRDNQLLDVDVTLGKRPSTASARGWLDPKKIEEMEKSDRESFFQQWLQARFSNLDTKS